MPRIAVAPLILLAAALARPAPAKPPSREEARRQAVAAADLRRDVAAEPSAAGKAGLVRQALAAAEQEVDVRRRAVEVAEGLGGAEAEAVLTEVLAGDRDAGVRTRAATALGKSGSARCLPALARAAAGDATTEIAVGCMRGQSNARRAATFALAELAGRRPALAAAAAEKLRDLPAAQPPPDNEGLADARAQALYQITRDDALLAPFRDRLKSETPHVRDTGVVAFRFLGLKAAPAPLVAALADPDAGVRRWAALVLGEIGDPQTVGALSAAAGDVREDVGVRCNALGALGRMRAAAAAGLVEKLLADPEANVSAMAAVSLYRITGKKAAQFPAGYDAD